MAQATQAVAAPILARLYSPGSYGVLTLLLSIAGLIAAIGGLRYDLAIVLCKTDEEAMNVVALYMWFGACAALVSLAVLVPFDRQFASAFGSEQLEPLFVLVPLIVVLTCAGVVGTNWLVRTQQFRLLANYRIGQALSLSGSQLALARPSGGGPGGLIGGTIIGLASVLLVVAVQLKKGYGRLIRSISMHRVREALRTYAVFPRYMVPYTIASVARDRGVIIILGVFSTTTAVGFYGLATRLVYTTVGAMSTSVIGTVIYQRAVAIKEVSELGPLIQRVLRSLVLVAAPPLVLLAWVSTGDNLTLLLGSQWREAATYVVAFVAPSFGFLLSGVLGRMLDVVGAQRTAFRIEASYSIVGLSLLLAGFAVFHSASAAVWLFAIATTAYHLVWIVAVYRNCHFPLTHLRRLAADCTMVVASTLVVLLLLDILAEGWVRVGIATGLTAIYCATTSAVILRKKS